MTKDKAKEYGTLKIHFVTDSLQIPYEWIIKKMPLKNGP